MHPYQMQINYDSLSWWAETQEVIFQYGTPDGQSIKTGLEMEPIYNIIKQNITLRVEDLQFLPHSSGLLPLNYYA